MKLKLAPQGQDCYTLGTLRIINIHIRTIMSNVNLEDEEWQRVIQIIAQAPWNIANPLLMRIGDQLRRQPNGPMPEMSVPKEEPPKHKRQ
jgi:hypothetical protein